MQKLKESFVAFIDVLGFKELVYSSNLDEDKLSIIKHAIEKAMENLNGKKRQKDNPYRFWFEEFHVKSFSDCFCFSVPLEFEDGEKDYRQNLIAFYVWLKVFYNEMLMKGFLCRGGIAQGLHYVDDNIIFSRAQIDAYQQESQKTVYPVIAIHSSLLAGIEKNGLQNTVYNNYMFAHDNAGRKFLHPFNYSIVDEMFFGFRDGQTIKDDIDVRNILLKKYLNILEWKIKRDFGNSFVDKSQWLKEFILFTLEEKYNDKFYKGLIHASVVK